MLVTPRILDLSQSTGPRHRLTQVLLAVLALLICYQAFYCLTSQKSLGWDASMGFLTLQSSLEHGDFNRLHHPDVNNLAEDRAEFIAWWTPGQYLIPHWAAKALGTNIGNALRIVTVLCSWAGLVGCYLLYTKLGFNRPCVCLCLIVVCSQHYFLKSSRVYSGGDLLLFSAAPYLALGALAARTSFHWRALVVALACFSALFLKASALTYFLALMLYLALEIHGWPGRRLIPSAERGVYLRRLLILGGIIALYVAATYLAYLSRGVTISSSARSLDSSSLDRFWGIPVALAGPLYGAFSFFEPYSTTTFFIPMALLGLFAILKLGSGFQTEGLPDYRRMLVAHYLAFLIFFSYAYIRGMGISYEPRHFRMVGLILLPGLVHGLLHYKHQTMMAGVIAALSLASVAFYHLESTAGSPPVNSASRWGIRQPLSNDSLEALHRVDRTYVTKNTIVFNGLGACPALLLEFNNGRKLQDGNFVNFGFKAADRTAAPMAWYRNAAESIVLLVPQNTTWFFGPSLEEIARTFERPLQVAPCFENSELTIYTGSVR